MIITILIDENVYEIEITKSDKISTIKEKIIEQFPYKEKINTMISTSDKDIQLV